MTQGFLGGRGARYSNSAPLFTSQNCGYVLTNSDSRLFAISIEDLLVGIRIKLQYTPEKRRYSNFDLLVTLKHSSEHAVI
jgi:hypothetical protein